EFNPFVDATPSGLAIGVVAQQAGGGGSLLDRAVDHLGDAVGGIVSFSTEVAHFVTTNPVARLVLNVAAIAVPIACKFLGPACVSPGGVIIRAVAVVNFVAAVRDIANSCPAGEATRCGIGIALAALSVVEFVFARQIAGAFISQRVTAVNGRPPVNAS